MGKPTHSSASGWGYQGASLTLASLGRTPCSCHYNPSVWATKQEKTRLLLELRESTDQSVRNAGVKVRTGRKWDAQTEVDRAVGRLQHQAIVGRVQAGRAGLGWGEAPRFWVKGDQS